MAAETRTSADALSLLRALEERPYEFDFYWALRHIECLYPDKPRLGEAARPVDEPVRLTQEPSLAFAPSTLASFEAGDGSTPHRLSAYFFGLFGPHGPLPLHLTEYARDREINEQDPTFRRFADIFHHRLMLLFYRAWANANPATSLDRPGPRRFDTYVGSVFGLGMETLRGRDAVPDHAKLYLAGLLSLKTRPAAALVAMLKEFLQLPFRLHEFFGAWMQLPADGWSRLGTGPRGSTLGADALLGSAVWSCQHRFRLVCGPIGFAEFKRLLPGRDSLRKLHGLVRNYLGDEFEWDLNLVLFARDVPALRLGQSGELGWTTWLGRRQTDTDASEVVISPAAAHG
jgi:type VI secretion system protein ImpH